MPKNARPRMDVDRGQWEPSSSSEEDWGNGEWEVLRIAKDHVNTRGDLRFNVPSIQWADWKRDDGSDSTWEVQDGTTMQDLALVQKRWQTSQEMKISQEANSPTVPPFVPSPCFDLELDENADERKKAKSKQEFRYTFTELAHQTRQMAIHLRDENRFSEQSSLIEASIHLQSMRNTRDSALEALDTTVSEAPSLCLYDLGRASQWKGRYQAQKKTSLHRQMRSLHVSKPHLRVLSPARSEPSAVASVKPALKNQAPSSLVSGNMFSDRPPENPTSRNTISLRDLPPPSQRLSDVPEIPQRNDRTSDHIEHSQSVPPSLKVNSSDYLVPDDPTSSQQTTERVCRNPFTGFSLGQEGIAETDLRSKLSSSIVTSMSKRKRKVPAGSSIASSSRNSCDSGIATPPSIPSPRDALQAKWSKAVQLAGAASVTLVDDFDMESAPVDDIAAFTYVESDYIFDLSVPQPDGNFIESCECTLGCYASLCSCQDDSVLVQDDKDDSKVFAYDAKGLFAFPHNMRSYVVECNRKCLCGVNCHSRVAQRPRKFPIEIFRTERCGWGVRSAVDLPKGSVLGIYTGKLIPCPQSAKYDGKRGNYIFDLDFFYERTASMYSVDAYDCGNWTRFINHSCNPVCILYPVVWDSAPSMHQPKLVFVAKTEIPARSELSIDYSPKVRKGKRKAKPMQGTADCACGSEDCWGYIYDP